jgi:hypothetical protein
VSLRVFTAEFGLSLDGGRNGQKTEDSGFQGAGTITQLPSGRWRLRVTFEGRQVTYGTYSTEDEAADGQARWRLTHLLPKDDPEQAVELPASVGVGRVRCSKWFERWQEAKKARRSLVRMNKKRGGAESTAARDRAYWSKRWAPPLGSILPHMVTNATSSLSSTPWSRRSSPH